jgi:hypothetical protein
VLGPYEPTPAAAQAGQPSVTFLVDIEWWLPDPQQAR